MRRLPKSLLVAFLSQTKPLRRHGAALPLLRPAPPPRPRLLPFSVRTLSKAPPPDAASTAKPDGLAFLEAGELQESASEHHKAFDLALKALGPLQESHGGWSLPVARALRLAGAAGTHLGLLTDSLDSLNAAVDIVDYLESGTVEVAKVAAAVREQLGRTNTAMGRPWDAVADLRRALELKCVFLQEGSVELGDAYRDVAEAYVGVLDFEKALPLSLKALEIAKKRFGEDTTEVAKVRRILMVAYTGLGRNEEALQQNELTRMVYDRMDLDVELSFTEIDGANVLNSSGRPEEAMSLLKRVMQRAKKDSEERALAFVAMANILCSQERFSDTKRCLEIGLGILDTKGSMSHGRVAEAYAQIAMLYETMTDFEVALCLMKRILASFEGVSGSEVQHIQGTISARLGWLLLHTERAGEAIPYLERAVDKLKNCFGPKHYGLGFAYRILGEACTAADQLQSAVKFLALASDIIVPIFGPIHEDSININQCLANAYGLMGSYERAMEFQNRVVAAYESCGPDSSYDLTEARRLQYQLKIKAQGLPHAVFPAYSLPASLTAKD